MKHIKLFEAFINEANSAVTKLVTAFENVNNNIESGDGEVVTSGNAILFTVSPEFSSDILEIVIDMKLPGHEKYTEALELMMNDEEYEEALEDFDAKKYSLELLMASLKKSNVGYMIADKTYEEKGNIVNVNNSQKEIFIGTLIDLEPYGYSLLGVMKPQSETTLDKKTDIKEFFTEADNAEMQSCLDEANMQYDEFVENLA